MWLSVVTMLLGLVLPAVDLVRCSLYVPHYTVVHIYRSTYEQSLRQTYGLRLLAVGQMRPSP